MQGTEHFNRLVVIDQSPIGKTPRSTPATATGLLQVLRPLYAQLPLSKQRGYTAARFSPNIRGGRCERCQGTGMIEVDMNFLGNVAMPCDACHGQCYNRETLEVTWKGKSIAQALALTVDEAAEFFSSLPRAAAILKSMQDVGLGYLNLNRRADTLSGGESQRIKIAAELAKAPSWKLAEDGKGPCSFWTNPPAAFTSMKWPFSWQPFPSEGCRAHHPLRGTPQGPAQCRGLPGGHGPRSRQARRQYRGRGLPRRCSVQSGIAHFSLARPPLTTAAPENHSSVLSSGHPVPGVFGKNLPPGVYSSPSPIYYLDDLPVF